jgi:nitrite reductase/ring-hydroxylating ferredoxin subunit
VSIWDPVLSPKDWHGPTQGNYFALLAACGHITEELDSAIITADKAIEDLKVARERAVARFKANGVCFSVDESKRKEIEAARLQ